MRKSGFGVVQQREIVVFCDNVIVGEYTANLLVEDQVIVELKVARSPLSRARSPLSRARSPRPAYAKASAGRPDRENHPASSPLIPPHPP
jgi:hypothetical protein